MECFSLTDVQWEKMRPFGLGKPTDPGLTCAPTPLHSKMESWFIATPTVAMFLSSVERRFPVPATPIQAVARSLGQGWPKATGAAGAQRP